MLFTIAFCLLAGVSIQAQQIGNWSSFYENGFIWNPALTANWSYMETTVTHRQDWTGFEGAPVNSSIGIQYPFLKRITRVSIGGYIEQDRVGPYSRNTGAFTYSYRFVPKFQNNYLDQLRLAASAQFHQFRYDPSNLVWFEDQAGNDFDQISSLTAANIMVGAYYVSIDDFNDFKSHYYLGLSFNQLVPTRNTNFADNTQVLLRDIYAKPHVSLNAGYRWLPSRRSRHFYEPNVLISYAFNKAVNAMFNVRYEQQNAYWASIGAVTNGELFLQGGVILTEDSFMGFIVREGLMKIGAKMDYHVGRFGRYSGIGYEFYLAYMFDMDKQFE